MRVDNTLLKIKNIIFTACVVSLLANPVLASVKPLGIEVNPDSRFGKFFYSKAEIQVSNGQYIEAADTIKKVLSFNDSDVKARFFLGQIYEYLGNYQQAAEEYKNIIKTEPDNVQILYFMGLILDKLDKTNEAMDYMDTAAASMKNNPLVNYDSGVIAAKLELYDKAALYSQRAIDAEPKFAEAFNNLCYSQAMVGNYLQALDNCNKSLAILPGSAATLDSLGYVYYGLGQFDKAIAAYTSALKTDPTVVESYYHLGLAYAKMGNRKKAVQYLHRYKKFHPEASNIKEVNNFIKAIKKGNSI